MHACGVEGWGWYADAVAHEETGRRVDGSALDAASTTSTPMAMASGFGGASPLSGILVGQRLDLR